MERGSAIVIAEARLQQTKVVWRVRPGAGYASAGGQLRGSAGVLALDGWDDEGEAICAEAHRALNKLVLELRRMVSELGRVRPLPLGEMSDLV